MTFQRNKTIQVPTNSCTGRNVGRSYKWIFLFVKYKYNYPDKICKGLPEVPIGGELFRTLLVAARLLGIGVPEELGVALGNVSKGKPKLCPKDMFDVAVDEGATLAEVSSAVKSTVSTSSGSSKLTDLRVLCFLIFTALILGDFF